MLIIGLTGNIGSGKSTVANLFSEFGIPNLDSDQIAREVVLPGTQALTKIIDHFGERILLPDGTLDRKQMRDLVFTFKDERLWLEALLHPLIREKMAEKLEEFIAPYALLQIPLLIGRPKHPLVQRILLVDSLTELQKQRVLQRDSVDLKQLEATLEAQAKRDALLTHADDVIVNNATLNDLKQQVLVLHERYLRLGF